MKLYIRQSASFAALSFDARSVFKALLTCVDRAGLLELGKHHSRAVAAAIGATDRVAMVEQALAELREDGCLSVNEETGDLLLVNFVAAQSARMSDKAKKQAQRERARAAHTGTRSPSKSPKRHEPSPAVTQGHPRVPTRIEEIRSEEDLSPPASASRPVLKLEKTGPKKRKKPKPSEAEEFWTWCMAERTAGGLFADPVAPDVVKLRTWFKSAVELVGLERLKGAYRVYLSDGFAAKEGCPFPKFMSEGIWTSRTLAAPPPSAQETPLSCEVTGCTRGELMPCGESLAVTLCHQHRTEYANSPENEAGRAAHARGEGWRDDPAGFVARLNAGAAS